MNTPLLSVVIANYNYGRFLEDAIQSVIKQNVADKVELIICDAASTDNSVEIIKKYANGLPPNTSYVDWHEASRQSFANNSQLISWWCTEKDGGQSAAFNKGFAHAKGKYLTWLNADDMFVGGSLKMVLRYIEQHPNVEWLSAGTVFCDSMMRTRWFRIGASCPPFLSVDHLPMHVVGGPSSIFLAEKLIAVGGLDERLHYMMDTDLWMRFFRSGMKLVHLNTYMWAFRVHEDSKTSCTFSGNAARGHIEERSHWFCRMGLSAKTVKGGEKILFVWKLLTGSLFRSYVDTLRFKGRDIYIFDRTR